MMYIRFTPQKTIIFTVFMLGLAAALALSISAASTLPGEYLRLKGLTAMGKMPFKSMMYGLDYTSQGQADGLSFASIGNFFLPAKVNLDVATNTPAHDIPVLLYHGIVDTLDRFSMTPETFAEQMFALKRAGYHTVTLSDFNLFMEGKKELDNKSFLLTFDDARIDAYWGADPVLQALGFTAVMFVATADSIDVPRPLPSYYIHEGLLGRMVRSGRWELGSHGIQQHTGFIPIDAEGTKANFLSNKMWLADEGRIETDDEYRARIIRELVVSKQELEESFGVPIISVAYPFGDYGQQTKNNPGAQAVIEEIVRSTYELGFRQVWAYDSLYNSNYRGGDPIHIRRIEAGTDWSGEELLTLILNAGSKKIPYPDDFSVNRGWKFNWGTADLSNGKLRLQSGASTTGSITFLDGTREWQDYHYSVSATRDDGQYVSLIARFQDNNNYVSCWFSDGQVKIMEEIAGNSRTLVKVRHVLQSVGKTAALGISVEGTQVTCYNGTQVAAESADLNPRLSSGGVGMSVWDEVAGKASAEFSSLKVVPSIP